MATASETLPGSESVACRETDRWRNWGSPWGSQRMSSGSKARRPSDRHGPRGGGSARSTEEAGQCPLREGAEQDSLLDEGYTAAPEAEPTVSTQLAGLVARARKEARLTNVVQFVDEELLRLAFPSLRKQAAHLSSSSTLKWRSGYAVLRTRSTAWTRSQASVDARLRPSSPRSGWI